MRARGVIVFMVSHWYLPERNIAWEFVGKALGYGSEEEKRRNEIVIGSWEL